MDHFLEIAQPHTLHVVTGAMKGGKTLEFIHRLHQAEFRRIPVQAFRPNSDDRPEINGPGSIGSRGLGVPVEYPAILVPDNDPYMIFDGLTIEPFGIVGIEEVHLFDNLTGLVEVVLELRDRGFAVLACGLDRNYRGEPYDPLPELMAYATTVSKHFGSCTHPEGPEDVCGRKAEFTQRFDDGEPAHYGGATKVVGDQQYVPRCFRHHIVPGKPR
tara:strand:+ start:657 stop:1301 length:645 start_codon:yes stop_codon:yes gene_type:complete